MSRPTVRWPSPCFAPAGGDGASPGLPLDADLARKAGVLSREETGLRFEPLVLFAEPLFDHYELDPADAFKLKHDPRQADAATVAALEAARLLWAYFSLPPERRAEMLDRLADYLLGPAHAPEDEADLELLLERMQEQWNLLTPEDRRVAEQAEALTLDFEAVLAHPILAHGGDSPQPTGVYGPERLSQLEAQALFAQPLLNAAEDPDEMELALERAHAYWEIAHQHLDQREQQLGALLDDLAGSSRHRDELEREARQMIARFDELFPEHAT